MRQPWSLWPGHHLTILAALLALTAAAEWTRTPARSSIPASVTREASATAVGQPAPDEPLARVDEALTRRDVGAALAAWSEAHDAAIRSGGWEALVDVGDAWLRIGDVGGEDAAPYARARDIYLAALARARREGSTEGVLRIAQTFGALGDDDLVKQCVRIAERLTGQDPEGRADLSAFTARLASGSAR